MINPIQDNKELSKDICIICSKPVQQKYKPFCSKNCADIDLSKWLQGSYVISQNDHNDI